MASRSNVSLALNREVAAGAGRPELDIAVVFTSVESTARALRAAGSLARREGARITIIVPQIVPFPVPLTSPPVLLDWNEKRFRAIAEQSPVETSVHLYLCRDRPETLLKVLPPRSLVVIGGSKRRWWPTAEEKLARRLEREGHEVVYCTSSGATTFLLPVATERI